MADIDKSLPNVKTSITVDPEEEIEIAEQKEVEASEEPVEVNPQEDGSVEINFDPSKVNIEGQQGHFDNLAELLPEDILDPIGSELVENYMDYKSSRKDWEQSYTTGLELLGFKYENRSEPFQGASGATHPVLAEAVTQFQAGAYKELLPAEGPVRTQVVDLEGFEDKDDELNDTGIKLPYIVTIDESSRQVLSIRRNFEPTDAKKNKIQYFVHFKFLPGLGFYGFGLIHMIGGLSRTATAALRQLLDAGTLSNLPAGFKQRGIRVRDEAAPLQPGEFRDVDAPGGNLRDAFMTLPYKEPSGTLLQLMGIVVQAGQRFAAIADMQVGDGNQGAAVGTTVALLERGSRVMSAIHKRLYSGMKQEFRLLSKVFKTYLPPVYPFDVVGGRREIKQMDFDDRVDILPVADPNIFSMAQRISMAQTELQLATSQPQLHNLYAAYRKMYEALGIKNIDQILPPPAPVQPIDPSLEHINALGGKPFQAFRGQDHTAHITSHLTFMSTNMVRNNPQIMASIQKNILEHISLMAQEQVELEFAEPLQQMQMLQVQAQQDPQAKQQLQQLSEQIEARKAVLIAELTGDFAKEEKEITSQFDSDPLLKLKSREVDLRAMENERKKEADEAKADLDRAKLVQARDIFDDKLEQNQDLAELRAGVSLAKKNNTNIN